VLEEQVSNLAGHFRYLALLLDAYDKRCPKIDHLSDNCSFRTLVFLAEYRETQHHSKLPFGSQALRGWGYILTQD
jgi:hypothetical protein